MTSVTTFSPCVQAALDSVDEDTYTTRPDGTVVPQSSSPVIIATMLDLLDVEPGMCVLEMGTGSGYSTALLSQLVGDDGHITSVEIDPALATRAEQLLHADGRRNVDLITGDGVKGAPGLRDHFHRVIAWATVGKISRDWTVQAAPNAVIVTPVNLAGLAKTHAVVRARYDATIPDVVGEKLVSGGFVEAHDQVIDQWLVPPYGADVLARDNDANPWWLSAQWLRTRDGQQAGRGILDQLITASRTAPGPLTADESGTDFYAYLLAARPQGLTTAALGDPTWSIGYSNPAGTALIPAGEGQNVIHIGDPSAYQKLLETGLSSGGRSAAPGTPTFGPSLAKTSTAGTFEPPSDRYSDRRVQCRAGASRRDVRAVRDRRTNVRLAAALDWRRRSRPERALLAEYSPT